MTLPAIDAQLCRATDAITRRLGEELMGLYLHGSLAMTGFNPHRSDIDLLAVTRLPLAVETKHALATDLLAISGNPRPLEISFLTWDDLHPWRHPTPFDLHFSESWREAFTQQLASGEWRGWSRPSEPDGDLAGHVTVVRARGRTLWGQPIAQVFPPVPPADYLDSIHADFAWSQRAPLEESPDMAFYLALNLCRTLAYRADGQVRSKAEGGAWALVHLPEDFHPLVRAALAVYQSEPGKEDPPAVPLDALRGLLAYYQQKA